MADLDPQHQRCAEAASRACVRSSLVRCGQDRSFERAAEDSVVEGTWIGGWIYREREERPACSVCAGPLSPIAQVDPSPVLGEGVGLWCVYLCDACLDEQFPKKNGAHAVVHYPRPTASAWLKVEDEAQTSPQSRLVAEAWELTARPGTSFPAIEDFFDEVIDDCPSPEQEEAYERWVHSIDPLAPLSSNGCFFGERRVQVGGYVELFDNLPGPRCAHCQQEMFLLVSIPNVPRVFGPWLDNYGMAIWVCQTHPETSHMHVGCAKFG